MKKASELAAQVIEANERVGGTEQDAITYAIVMTLYTTTELLAGSLIGLEALKELLGVEDEDTKEVLLQIQKAMGSGQ